MRRLLLMAKRDYLESVRTKAFLIGLVVAPLLFGSGFLGIAILKKKPDLHDKRIAILDRTGLVAPGFIEAAGAKNEKDAFAKKTHEQIAARYIFENVAPSDGDPQMQRLALSDRVRRGELFAYVEIWPEALHPGPDVEPDAKLDVAPGVSPDASTDTKPVAPRVAYYTNASAIDQTRAWLREPMIRALRTVQLTRLGVDRGHFEELLATVPIDPLSLLARDESGAVRQAKKKDEAAEFAVPFGLVMLQIMIVMIGAAPMLSAVTEDKNQRIFEMLLGLATPMELMAARVLAALGRSLTSSAFYIFSALMVLQGMSMMGVVPFHLLPWFFIYVVANVTMMCSLAAALGAACNSPQDAQNLAVVLAAPIMIPAFLLMPVMSSPNGGLATAMSLIPPFTPVVMLLRQALPVGVPAWQPWAGLAGVMLWTVGSTWVAARIFRVGILLQGQSPKLSALVRLAWAG